MTRLAVGVMLLAACGRFDFEPITDPCALHALINEPYATDSEPFLICTNDQFARIAERPDDWNKSFVLGADLDVASLPVTPIGTDPLPFTGTFDGAGHAISNLQLDLPAQDYVGLFAHLGDHAHLANLMLHGVDVKGAKFTGALVGYSDQNILVEHILVDGAIVGQQEVGGVVGYANCDGVDCTGIVLDNLVAAVEVTGGNGTGGVVGGVYNAPFQTLAQFDDLHASGHVTGTGYATGGVVGDLESARLTRSSSSVVVNAGGDAGGLVGVTVYSPTTIERSFATGDVTCTGDSCAGLISDLEGSVIQSYATGRVQCGGNGCAGLVSAATPLIAECYATGDVTGVDGLGGLVGNFYGTEIRDSYASGRVQGRNMLGGFAGIAGTSNNPLVIRRAYSTSTVIGTDQVGGLVGFLGVAGGTTSVVDSFSVATVNGSSPANRVSALVADSIGTATTTGNAYVVQCTNASGACKQTGTALTAASDFYVATTPPLTAWDFSTVWQEVPGDYPKLRGAP